MKLRITALLTLAVALGALTFGSTSRAAAHPLGNFTINHSTTIEVAETGITVHRVLDLAEIPAFQDLQQIPRDASGAPMLDGWASARAAALATGMRIEIDGDPVALTVVSRQASLLEGQGGLQTLRLDAVYGASFADGTPAANGVLTYVDDNYADRIGWREVIVRGGPGVDLAGSTLPAESVTNALRIYPDSGLSSPPAVREVTVSFGPGVGLPPLAPLTGVEADHARATRGNPDGALAGFTRLISEEDLSAGFIALALLAAVAFGAIHALSPGHGKTVVAAYLVGSRGTLRHAALLGLVVTLTHTSSVYALGFVTLYLSQFIVPEDLYPWMGVLSGGIIVVMGLALFVGRLRASGAMAAVTSRLRPARLALAGERGGLRLASAGAAPSHDHTPHADAPHADAPHAEHIPAKQHGDHHHADTSTHSHRVGSHSHAMPGADGEAVTWRRLVGLGIFGGMIPCPSAIVVMLSAIALHRVGFGLVLIVAFSFGLAAVLTGIGFAVVWAQRVPLLQRLMDGADRSTGAAAIIVRGLPIAAAALVCVVGVVLVTRAVGQF